MREASMPRRRRGIHALGRPVKEVNSETLLELEELVADR
jgi:hypothetical protein